MNWSSGFQWFKPLQSWPIKRSSEPDHGDMGTAFGLDASMAPHDTDFENAHLAATASPKPWAHRLTRRSSL